METKTKWILGGLALTGLGLWLAKRRIDSVGPALSTQKANFKPEGNPDLFPFLKKALPESGKIYAPLFWEIGQKHDVSPFLLAAIADHETGGTFEPKRVRQNFNERGEKTTKDYGLMQINEVTLKHYNEKGDFKWDNPRDSIIMGAMKIRDGIQYMKDEWNRPDLAPALRVPIKNDSLAFDLGLLAYNWGNKGAREGFVLKKLNPRNQKYYQLLMRSLERYRSVYPLDALKPKVSILTRNGALPLDLEIAVTEEEKTTGLAKRREPLDNNEGMLFIFRHSKDLTAITVEETYIPLDVLFLSNSGNVQEIYPNAIPLSKTLIPNKTKSRYVLEVRGGFSAEKGISVGDVVDLSDVKRLFPY